MTALIILTTLVGAFWRRALGGWRGPFLWALDTPFQRLFWKYDENGNLETIRGVIVALGVPLAWSLWLILPWWGALVGTVLCGIFFTIGHVVETPWKRYGPFGVAYWIPMKYWNPAWNKPPLIDGWIAVGELLLGGLFWGAVAALALI
jgi:hypothetical protein